MTTKISHLKSENKLSYRIKVQTEKETFTIPVIDVRDGESARQKAKSIIKAQNNSKFMKPSFSFLGYSYQTSMKK